MRAPLRLPLTPRSRHQVPDDALPAEQTGGFDGALGADLVRGVLATPSALGEFVDALVTEHQAYRKLAVEKYQRQHANGAEPGAKAKKKAAIRAVR